MSRDEAAERPRTAGAGFLLSPAAPTRSAAERVPCRAAALALQSGGPAVSPALPGAARPDVPRQSPRREELACLRSGERARLEGVRRRDVTLWAGSIASA